MSDNEQAKPEGEATETATPEMPAEVHVVVPDGQPVAEGEEAPKRRVRRSRSVAVVPEPPDDDSAPPSDGERAERTEAPRSEGPRSEGPRSEGPRSEGPREGRPKRPRRPRNRGPKGDSAILQAPQRKIYRQDVPSDRGVASDRGAGAPPSRPEAPKKRDINEKDKITLILHPAPKPGARPGVAKKKDRPKTAKEALQAKTKVVAKKDDKRDKAKKEPPALDPSWLSADESNAADAMRNAGDAGEALVKAWVDAGNVGAIARAAQLDDLTAGPRKAARRALNVLKSRGIAIPKMSEPSKAPSGPEPPVAKFIPPDASGTSFVSISQRQAGGRYLVADVLYRTGVGVVHATAARLAGHHIRDWESRIEKQFGAKPVGVPVDWARHQVAEARKQNDASKSIVPLGFDSCGALINPAPATAPPHPLADLEEPDDGAVDKAKLGSDSLHNEPEFRTWMPDRGAIDELLRKVGERLGDEGAAQDSSQVDEALRAEVAAATDRFFSPELRQELSERMRGAAISVRARAGDDDARRVLAVAKAVRDAGLITSPPSEVPFLLTFFQKAIAMMVRQGAGQLRVPVPQRQGELAT